MPMLKILNLYAGIGGNRKLWGDELDDLFPGTRGMSVAVLRKDSELDLKGPEWIQL